MGLLLAIIGIRHTSLSTRTIRPNHPPYTGIVKLAGEHLGLRYQRRYGLEFITIRFASTVGPGKLRRHGLYAQHSTIVENAMAGQATHLPRGADAVHDPVYHAELRQWNHLRPYCSPPQPTPPLISGPDAASRCRTLPTP